MKKVCKYSLAAAILVFLLSQSVYLRNLAEFRQQRRGEAFNAAAYAEDFWFNRLPLVLDEAVDVKTLIELFHADMSGAIDRYGKAPGVSRVYAYLLKGGGTILAADGDGLKVSVKAPHADADIVLETGFYIAGNAVRDASGLVDVSNFSDTMKFNEIGGEINRIIVREVIRPFLDTKPTVGQTVSFLGATQVSRDTAEEDSLRLIKVVPIKLELK